MTNDVTMMEHQRIQDEALDLVFAAVEPADMASYDAHLAECDQCREFVDELTSLVGLVGAVGDVEAPPASLRAAILAEAAGLSVTRLGTQPSAGPVPAPQPTDSDIESPAPGVAVLGAWLAGTPPGAALDPRRRRRPDSWRWPRCSP